MLILSLDTGSATLRFGVFDPASATPPRESTVDRPAVDGARPWAAGPAVTEPPDVQSTG